MSLTPAPTPRRPVAVQLAADIACWFPALGGRAVAVSEVEVTKENIPTLPVAMVALVRDAPEAYSPLSNQPVPINEELVIEFWLEVERYRRADGSESPFWAFYDYEPIRDRLLYEFKTWVSPRGGRLRYRGLDLTTTDFAVVVSFRVTHSFEWCQDGSEIVEEDEQPMVLCLDSAPHYEPHIPVPAEVD